MIPQPPEGQPPINPRGAFTPPPPAPPQYMMPPMPPMPPMGWPPPPRRRSFLRTAILAVIVLALLGSVFLNMVLVGNLFGGSSNLPTTVQEGDRTQVIAVIPVTGMIGERSAEHFNRFFDQIDKDPNVKAVVLHVETPGGSVTSSDEMYHRIDRFKLDHPQIPVVVSMGGFATSGGYYISARADYIFAAPTTWTGNIGVIAPMYNVSDLASRWGVKEQTITAPADGFKNAGSPFAPLSESDKAYLQSLVDSAYKRFVKVVKDGRGPLLKEPIEKLADGRVFIATDALAVGLVDQIGYPDEAYAYAATKAGLSKPRVVRYREPQGLFDLLGASSKTSAPAAAAGIPNINNGVNVNVNLDLNAALREMASPKVMYLWQGR